MRLLQYYTGRQYLVVVPKIYIKLEMWLERYNTKIIRTTDTNTYTINTSFWHCALIVDNHTTHASPSLRHKQNTVVNLLSIVLYMYMTPYVQLPFTVSLTHP